MFSIYSAFTLSAGISILLKNRQLAARGGRVFSQPLILQLVAAAATVTAAIYLFSYLFSRFIIATWGRRFGLNIYEFIECRLFQRYCLECAFLGRKVVYMRLHVAC